MALLVRWQTQDAYVVAGFLWTGNEHLMIDGVSLWPAFVLTHL